MDSLKKIVEYAIERKEEKIKFMLDKEFRELLIDKALENKSIYSIHDLARTLGYSGRNCNVSIWRFKNGQRSIPLEKLIFLCDLANIPFDEVYKHVTFLNLGKKVIKRSVKTSIKLQGIIKTIKKKRKNMIIRIEIKGNLDLNKLNKYTEKEGLYFSFQPSLGKYQEKLDKDL